MSIPCKMRPVGVWGMLPAGYKRVEWLQSFSEAGNCQWVTVLYNLNKITCISAVAEETQTTRACTVYHSAFFSFLKNINHWRFDFRGKFNRIEINPSRAESKFFVKENRAILNGIEYAVTPGTKTGNENRLHFLGQGYEDTRYHGGIRLFSASVQGEDGLVFDLVPALDPTGAPCLFDLVSKTPYYNKGTGDFAYPTESTTYSLRRMVPDWGKLTEHGLRRLYHAPEGYTGELHDYALENGFKPIIETEKPEEGYWAPQWTETDEEIVLEWIETEPLLERSEEPS